MKIWNPTRLPYISRNNPTYNTVYKFQSNRLKSEFQPQMSFLLGKM